MKFYVAILILAFVVCAMSMPANDPPHVWNMEACEVVAAKARRESTVCKDYQCIEHSYGLAVTGVDCIGPYE